MSEKKLDPKNTLVFKIDYENLATEAFNGEGKELYIEGEIDHIKENGVPCITLNLKIKMR